jgi:hypothetical protein
MTAIRMGKWRVELVAPVHVRRAPASIVASAASTAARSTRRVHRDPQPTPGAFEPPADLFREIARGGRALE